MTQEIWNEFYKKRNALGKVQTFGIGFIVGLIAEKTVYAVFIVLNKSRYWMVTIIIQSITETEHSDKSSLTFSWFINVPIERWQLEDRCYNIKMYLQLYYNSQCISNSVVMLSRYEVPT